MIHEHCSSLTFLPEEFLKHIRFTSCFHRVFVDMFENKSKSVNSLILQFISVLLRSIVALLFHTFCNSFMNTGYKFFIFYNIFIFYIVS